MSGLLKRLKAGSSSAGQLTNGVSSEPMFLSPWALLQRSFLAGSTLIVGAAMIVLDVSCIILLSWAFGYTYSLSLDDELTHKLPGSPLGGISNSILATAFWYGMQLCLSIDLCLALCTTSRELQEGSVYAYGIVSIWQIPLMVVCLGFELSQENKTWITSACDLTAFRPSCTDWWTSIRAAAIAPSIIASLFHATFFIFAFIFCRTRSPKSLRPPKDRRKLHKAPDDVQYPYDHRNPNPNKTIKPVPPPAGYSDSDLDEMQPPASAVSRTKVGADPPWLLRQGGSGSIAPISSTLPTSYPPAGAAHLDLGHEEGGERGRSRSSRSGRRGLSRASGSDDEPLMSSGDHQSSLSSDEEVRSGRRR